MSERHPLFVYGTLRRDAAQALHHLLDGHARFAGQARVRGRLYDLGPYPGMVAVDGDAYVTGELYELASELVFVRLDEYEGGEYRRVLVEALCENGRAVTAWAYILDRAVDGLAWIESGEWRARAPRTSR